MPKGLTDHLSKEIKNKYKFWNIYEINQINWDMKICCPKNNWISFDWIFKKYHAHSNYICTDLEGFASEKFKLFKSHSKISKKRPWTPPPQFSRGVRLKQARYSVHLIFFETSNRIQDKIKIPRFTKSGTSPRFRRYFDEYCQYISSEIRFTLLAADL